MKHFNNGNCWECEKLFNIYPDFNSFLKEWFKDLQKMCNDAHISCAGRGQRDQEIAFKAGRSKAHYGESAHNYSMAIDIFRLDRGLYSLDEEWFKEVVQQNIPLSLNWYGEIDAPYHELPHVELRNWKTMPKNLVEPMNVS